MLHQKPSGLIILPQNITTVSDCQTPGGQSPGNQPEQEMGDQLWRENFE